LADRVAITGATGVVGRAVLQAVLAEGWQVRALCRSQEAAAALEAEGAAASIGDLDDRESLRRLVSDCEFVFNVAGINEMCSTRPVRMRDVNVAGARNVLEACRSEGVRRLVHTSSATTIGERQGELANENSPHRGYFLSQYERTKYLGEMAVLENAGDVEVVCVNPSSVQGPGRSTGTGKIILDVLAGRLPALIDTMVSLVDIDDCARGHVLAALSGTPGERYILSGATVSVSDAVDLAAGHLGSDISLRMIPGWAVGAVGPVLGIASRVVPALPDLCTEMVRVLRFGHRYDGAKATSELGLSYRPLTDTLARTVDWFRARGLLESF
jgi:dihydroflavonol-4-reductase